MTLLRNLISLSLSSYGEPLSHIQNACCAHIHTCTYLKPHVPLRRVISSAAQPIYLSFFFISQKNLQPARVVRCRVVHTPDGTKAAGTNFLVKIRSPKHFLVSAYCRRLVNFDHATRYIVENALYGYPYIYASAY